MRALALATVLGAAACVAPEPTPLPGAYEDVRRVVAALDDVIGEYPLAIENTTIVDATRMRVLDTQLHAATVHGHRFVAAEVAAIAEVAHLVSARAAPARVVAAATTLRRRLLVDHQIVIAPAAPPDRERAVSQWQMLCSGCHGVTGFGDGPQGLQFDPEPKNFHSWDLMSTLAPTRAFSWISDGVPGTAMPQWGLFTTSERWGLAFLTFGFRHDQASIARGREIVKTLRMAHSYTALADLTDGDLLRSLEQHGLDGPRAADALAFLRTDSVFAPSTGHLEPVRAELADVIAEFRERRYANARASLIAARDKLAPFTTAVLSQEPIVAARLTDHLARLEAALVAATLDEDVEREVARIGALLDRAEQALLDPRSIDPLRLAIEWGLVPALALGVLVARRRGRVVGVVGVAVAGAVGAVLPGNLPLIGAAALALGLVIAVAAPALRRSHAPCAFVAAMVGLPLGVLARDLVGELGSAIALPAILAIAALAVAAAVVIVFVARLPPAAERVLTAVLLAFAVAACAGRGVWVLAPTLASTVRSLPTIEVLGVFPTFPAVVAAAVGWLLAFAAAVRRVESNAG